MIDGFEFNNPSSDRLLGAPDVAKNYMLGSYHQPNEFFEIIFNKEVYDGLAPEQQAILKYASEAASSATLWKAFDRYSNDLQGLQEEDGVTVGARRRTSSQPSSTPGTRSSSSCPPTLLRAGDRLAEGLGASGSVLRHVEQRRLQARLRALLRSLNI